MALTKKQQMKIKQLIGKQKKLKDQIRKLEKQIEEIYFEMYKVAW